MARFSLGKQVGWWLGVLSATMAVTPASLADDGKDGKDAPPPATAPATQPKVNRHPTTAPTTQSATERMRAEARERARQQSAERQKTATRPSDLKGTERPLDEQAQAILDRDAATQPATTQPVTMPPSRRTPRRTTTRPAPAPATAPTAASPNNDADKKTREKEIGEQIRKSLERQQEEAAKKAHDEEPDAATQPTPDNPESPTPEDSDVKPMTPPAPGDVPPPGDAEANGQPEQEQPPQPNGDAEQNKAHEPRPAPRYRPQPRTQPNANRPTAEKHEPNKPDNEKHDVNKPRGTAQRPVTPATQPMAPDGRDEFFNFDGMDWQEVLKIFAERIGKPWMNPDDAPGGQLTYKTDKRFTLPEAIDELNLIMYEIGYRFVDIEGHLYVLPLADIPGRLNVHQIFESLDKFDEADPPSMEFVQVFVQITDRPAQEYVDLFSDIFGAADFPRLSTVGDTNQIRITGLARDIRKFVALRQKINDERFDPREIKLFKIKTNVREIEQLVRTMIGAPAPTRKYNPQTRQFEQVGGDDNLQMVTDERTNTLIVKATPEILTQISDILDKLDREFELKEFGVHVIEIKNGSASEIASILNEIFRLEQGTQTPQLNRGRPIQPQQRNPNQRNNPNMQTAAVGQGAENPYGLIEDIFERAKKTVRLVADERTNSLIVYANEDGLERVNSLLEVIDKPIPTNFHTIKIKNTRASEIYQSVTDLVNAMRSSSPSGPGTGRGGSSSRQANVVLDENQNALHVIADRDQLKKITEIIERLDVAATEDERHVVELHGLKPSEVAQTIQTMLDKGNVAVSAGGGGRRGPRGGNRASQSQNGSQVIALDEAGLLVVICPEDDWKRVEDYIHTWDEKAVSNLPQIRSFKLENADAAGALQTLRTMYSNYVHPTLGQSRVFLDAIGDTIYVQAIGPALDEIAALVAVIDVPKDETPVVIFPLEHADSQQVAQLLQPMVQAAQRSAGGRGGMTNLVSVQAEPTTNSLIIRADNSALEEFKDFASRMDQQAALQQPVRKIFVPRNAPVREIAESVNNMFGRSGGRGGFGNSAVKVSISGAQLVVEAPTEKMAEIEQLIIELDNPGDREIVIRTLKMPAVDVQSVASKLSQAFAEKSRRQGVVARFDADAATETILMTISRSELDEAERLLEEFKDAAVPLSGETAVVQLKNAQSPDAANWLKNELTLAVARQYGRNAAQQVSVTADQRTNRVILNGPQVAVKQGLELLKLYDVPLDEGLPDTGVYFTDTRKLPGLDVANIAQQLTQVYQNRQRPDRLRYTFGADRLTETLIITAPKDAKAEIDELIGKFVSASDDLKMERRFYELKFADANYIADQLRQLLPPELAKTNGQDVANRVTILPEPRLNRVVVNLPKLAVATADKLVEDLDQPEVIDSTPVTIEVTHAKPEQIVQIINQMFGSGRTGGFRGAASSQEVSATAQGTQIVVRAPAKKMDQIKTLIAKLDVDEGDLEIRAYPLKILNATQVAAAVQLAIRSMGIEDRPGRKKPNAFPEPTTNTLVVLGDKELLPMIDQMVMKFESESIPQSDMKVYELKNAQSGGIAQSVDSLLKAKIAEQEGNRASLLKTAVVADPPTNRLFVLAPDDYQEMAAQLIKMLDADVDTGDVVRIVQLEQGSAADIAQTLSRSMPEATGGPGRSPTLRVNSDSGSNSVMLSGKLKDVEYAAKIIAELEVNNATVPELRLFKLTFADAAKVQEMMEKLYPPTGRNPAELVSFEADDYSNVLTVVANRRKMKAIGDYIKQFDIMPEPSEPGRIGNKEMHFVDIIRPGVDADDVEWEARKFFPDEDDGGPTIQADWDGEYIKVLCKVGEFSNIERIIREVESKQKVKNKTIVRAGLGAIEELRKQLDLLAAQNPNISIRTLPSEAKPKTIVEDLRGENEPRPEPRRSRTPQAPTVPASDANPRNGVNPFMLAPLMQDDLLRDVAAAVRRGAARENAQSRYGRVPPHADEFDDAAMEEIDSTDQQAQDAPKKPANDGEQKRAAQPATPAKQPAPAAKPNSAAAQPKPAAKPAATPPAGANEPIESVEPATDKAAPKDIAPKQQAVTITVTPDGKLIIDGPEKLVEDIESDLDKIEEDLAEGEVIRIFHFQYGDVAAADAILQRMFNDRQVVQQAPQQQQQQQQRNQQGRNQGGEGGKEGGDMRSQIANMIGGGGGAGKQQQVGAVGRRAVGGQRVRTATDVGNNYLIVKCDSSDLPEIRQLLRELDIPPGQVDLKVFQLKNLAAEETANNLKQILGIGRGGAGLGRGGGGAGGNPQQQQMLQIMQQQMVVDLPGGGGGAKIEQVEIVPNGITNALLVSAPPDVMDVIENTLTELEDLGGRDIIEVHQYPLENAKVDDILPLLQEVFAAVGSGGGAGGGDAGVGRRVRGGGGSPGALGPVTITSDPRTNSIIYTCEAKDKQRVEDQIHVLDIPESVTDAEMYICQFGDATSIAETVSSIFAGGGEGGRRNARGNGGGSATDLRIEADASTNSILVWGTAPQRDKVFEKIEQYEEASKRSFREVPLQNADAEVMAGKLMEMFGGSSGSGGSGGGRRNSRGGAPSGGGSAGHVTIVGDSNAKKLLVRASDALFNQIAEMAETLDSSKGLQVERFELKYAKADAVVDSFKTAMLEYMTVAQKDPNFKLDAFTAVPDSRTNSVLVVGSPQIFTLVKTMIDQIDRLPSTDQRQITEVYAIQGIEASVLADMINQSQSGASGNGGGGGRRGLMGGGSGSGADITVKAFADDATNTLSLYGTESDIAYVYEQVIKKYEDLSKQFGTPSTIAVQNTDPSRVVSYITQFLAQQGGDSRGGRSSTGRRTPHLVPNDAAGVIVVSNATEAETNQIQSLVALFDDPNLLGDRFKIIPVPYGQDATTLAREVERIVNQNEEALAQQQGRQATRVSVGSDEYSNAIIVMGDPSNFGMIEKLVTDIGTINPRNFTTRIIRLNNMSAEEAQQFIDSLQGRGGRTPARSTGGGGNGFFNQQGGFPGQSGGFNAPGGFQGRPGGFDRSGGGVPGQPQGNRFNPGGNRGEGGGNATPSRGGNRGNSGGAAPSGRQPRGGQPGAPSGGGRPRPAGGGGGGAFLWTPAGKSFTSPTGGGVGFVSTVPIVPSLFTSLWCALDDGRTPKTDSGNGKSIRPIDDGDSVSPTAEAKDETRPIDSEVTNGANQNPVSEARVRRVREIRHGRSIRPTLGQQVARPVSMKDIAALLDEPIQPTAQPQPERRKTLARSMPHPALRTVSDDEEPAPQNAIKPADAHKSDGTAKQTKPQAQPKSDDKDGGANTRRVRQQPKPTTAPAAGASDKKAPAKTDAPAQAKPKSNPEPAKPAPKKPAANSEAPKQTTPQSREPAAAKPDAAQPVRPRPNAAAASQPSRKDQSGEAGGVNAPAKRPAREKTGNETPRPESHAMTPPTTEPATLPVVESLEAINGSLRGDVTVSAVDPTTIVVGGDETDLEFIENVLSRLESISPTAQLRVFSLENAKATSIAEPVQRAVEAYVQLYGQPGARDRFTVIAEARSNSLIVAASERNMELIENLIASMDVTGSEIGQASYQTVLVEHARAADIAPRIQAIVQQLMVQRDIPQEARPTIQFDDRSNSIIIAGTPADIAEIERLVHTLDIDITDQDASFVRGDMIIIGLKNARAEDVAQTLTDMIKAEQDAAQEAAESGNSGGQGAAVRASKLAIRKLKLRTSEGVELPDLDLEKPIRIIDEKGTNSLIIYSSPKNNESLKALVGVLDTLPIGEETDVRAFALKYARAESISEMLGKLFEDSKKALARPADGDAAPASGVMPPVPPGLAGKGLPYNVVISHDTRSNTVFVVGRKDSVLLAGGLIEELDRPSLDLAMSPRIVPLKNTQASKLAEKLDDLLEKRATAIGEENNIARDSAVLIPDDRSNSLIIVATDEMYEMISDLARQIDASSSYRIVETRFRSLKFADSAKIQSLLQEVFDRKKEAKSDSGGSEANETQDALFITADPRSNSVLLTGTRDYLEEAEKMITNLDQSFDPTVVFKVRDVRMNSAANIAAQLSDFIEKSKPSEGGGESKLSGTPIYVSADTLSNTLLIAASAEDIVMIDRWVDVLDRPTDIGKMMRVIPLIRAKAEDVASSVQELFQNSRGGGGGAGGSSQGAVNVSITHDATTNSVIVNAPTSLLRDIEDIIRRIDRVDPEGGALIRIFKLKQADADVAGELLRNILEGRGGSVGSTNRNGSSSSSSSGGSREDSLRQVMLIYQNQRPEIGPETFRAMRSDINVISDLRTNSLVVIAPTDSMPLMESLVTAVDVPPDAAKIRVFPLQNSDAEEMVRTLEGLFNTGTSGSSGSRGSSSGGSTSTGTLDEGERRLTLEGSSGGEGREELSFTTDTRTNSVIAAGTKGYLDLVEELILQLDTQPIRERKTYVYSPRYNTAESLATSIKDFNDAEQQRLEQLSDEISAQRRTEREVTAIANEESNTVVLSYDPRFEKDVLDVVKELDQPPPQVMIQVLILEVTLENSLELGVEFAWQDLQFTKAGPNDTTTFDYVGGTDIGAAGAGLGGFTFTITGADFNFLLRTLQSERKLNVLSRPQIVAMNNQEASIKIVNNVPYASGTASTIGGSLQTQVQREDVGIELTVTPQINPDGFVRMEINQKVSDLTGSNVDVGQGVSAPIFFEREADTVVTVKDNETVVLGGLITTRDEQRETKVPIVGDIPGLGLLFRNQTDSSNRTELLIILTPRIVRTVEDYRSISLEERDRTGQVPREVLSNPLMQGLQLRPDAIPQEGYDIPEGNESGTSPDDQYGPLPPTHESSDEQTESESYDVPLSFATRSNARK